MTAYYASVTVQLPLHLQLYETLRERIRSGLWAEGSRVPSEAELMAEFGVSRAPVRQAMAALRAEGVIAGPRGAPPRVQPEIPSQPFTTFMSFTEWVTAMGRTPGQRTLEVARRPAPPRVAKQLRLTEGDPVVVVVRLRLLDEVPTMLEHSTYPLSIGVHLLTADLDSGSVYRLLREIGCEPTRARHLIDAVAAGDPEVRSLGVEPGSPLLRVRRTAYDQQGQPMEVADDRYLPHVANFVIENSNTRPSPLVREAGRF